MAPQKKRKYEAQTENFQFQNPNLGVYGESDINSSPTTLLEGNLDVRGTVRARAFSQMSDLRLKSDVQEIVDAIKIVSSLQGKTYKWKNSESSGNRVIGLIAQEVQKVLPEVFFIDFFFFF